MENTTPTISSEQLEKKVSSGYKTVYYFFFTRLPIILLILVAGIALYFFVFSASNPSQEDLKNNRSTIENPVLNNYANLYGGINNIPNDVRMIVKDGYFNVNEKVVTSVENLMKVKGWIMPNIVTINLDSLPHIQHFVDSGYDIGQLEKIIEDIVVRPQLNSTKYQSISRKTIPISDVKKTFTLSCLDGIKLNNYLCNQYIDEFLDVFYLYDINTVADQIVDVYDSFSKQQQQRFCDGALKYALFAHVDSQQMGNIFMQCGKIYLTTYIRNKNFYGSKSALKDGLVTEKDIHKDWSDLYLLLSLQQIISYELERSHVDTNAIYSYLTLVDVVLLSNKQENIPSIYYDWTVWFNKYILKDKLEKARYRNPNLQSDIERIIPEILKINNGRPSMGLKGLKNYILNPAILEKETYVNLSGGVVHMDALARAEELLNDLSFFVPISIKYADDNKNIIDVKGYFMVRHSDKRYDLDTKMQINSNDFKVMSVDIQEYKTFSNTINGLLKKNFFSIPDLYQYLTKNIKFYLAAENLDFCTMLQGLFTSETHEKDNKHYKTYCSTGRVYVSFSGSRYIMDIDGLSVNKIFVNDKKLQAKLNEKFLGDVPTELDLVNLIQDVIYYKLPDEKNDTVEGSTRVIVVLDKIKEYMNIKATDVYEQGEFILAEIVVKDIPFIVSYDFETDTISEVFFKNVKLGSSNNSLKVPNFNLKLNKENQKNINYFLIEPLQYIKDKNPRVYLEYLRYTSKRGK